MNRLWTALAATALASGCYLDLGEPASNGDGAGGTGIPVFGYEGAAETTPMAVRRSTLAGDMGAVEGFGGGVWLEQGERAEGWATVEIQAADRDDAWATMARVQVRGGIEELEPGLDRAFSFEDSGLPAELGTEGAGGEPGLWIDVVGCAGEMPGSWDFDEPAQQVEVQVDEGSEPGWLEVSFQATFQGFDVPETQLVTGSFEVEGPEEGTTTL